MTVVSKAPVAGALWVLAGECNGGDEDSGGARVLRVAGGRGSGLGTGRAGVAAGERRELRKMARGPCVLRASLLRSDGMEGAFRYRSQVITAAQVEFIRRLIAAHPGATRRRLSLLLCEAWDWKQANVAPRDMVCRGLMLGIYRAGHLELPPARQRDFNPATRYRGGRWKADAI